MTAVWTCHQISIGGALKNANAFQRAAGDEPPTANARGPSPFDATVNSRPHPADRRHSHQGGNCRVSVPAISLPA
jgi:hypothetical protein